MRRVHTDELDYNYVDGRGNEYVYDGSPFTGISFEFYLDRYFENLYFEGVKYGRQGWNKAVMQKIMDTEIVANMGHGIATEWHIGGVIKLKSTREYGIVISKKEWNKEQVLVNEFQLDEGNENYSILQKLKLLYDQSPASLFQPFEIHELPPHWQTDIRGILDVPLPNELFEEHD